MEYQVKNNPAANRFELAVDGQTAFVSYRRKGETLALLHTMVPKELSGRGIGTALGLGTLDALQAEGATIDPQCSFIARLIEEHPKYREMVG